MKQCKCNVFIPRYNNEIDGTYIVHLNFLQAQ